MFKDYKYSVISVTHITYFFFAFLLLSTSNVRMSEGTFCRVEVHIQDTGLPSRQDRAFINNSMSHPSSFTLYSLVA